jgi:hypothetical protein
VGYDRLSLEIGVFGDQISDLAAWLTELFAAPVVSPEPSANDALP